LQELFLTQLLPDRKLKVLESQPLGQLPPGREGQRLLLLWAVEDAVKSRYAQYVQLLEKARWAVVSIYLFNYLIIY
jgi:ribosome biogenesis protein MAK21